ncbi:MAG TPA: class I SAM-dependent methyltransferase [Solirubrobacterales bacterium]
MAQPEPGPETIGEIDFPLPPAAMRFMAESDQRFLEIGDETVADLREVVALGGRDRVLDIGCGYGRLAHALMRDPGFEGTYLGVDILERPVQWCQEELSPRSSGRLEFRKIDVANARYNPHGATPGHLADLEIEPGSFDVVALISVFTHLDPSTAEHYLDEIARALAPRGRAFISAFLLDDSWRQRDEAGLSPIPLPHSLTPFCRYQHEHDPLAAIAYQPGWLLSSARAAGLEPVSPPRLGTWCGRPDGVGHLDVLALRHGVASAAN